MDFLSVMAAMVLMTALFSSGWLSIFMREVRLGFKKDRFKCTQCGNCCRLRMIDLTREDIRRMEEKGLKGFSEKRNGTLILKRKNGRCMFLGRDDACSVYDVRPEVCRKFPFFKTWGLEYCRAVSFCPGVEKLAEKDG